MENIAQDKVFELLTKLNEIGVDDNKIVKIAILHVNQLIEQSSSTAKKLLYKSMMDILNQKNELVNDKIQYQCIIDWENHGRNKKDIKINLIDDIKLIDYSSMFETKFKRITINKDIKGGNPCVKGTRISVMNVLSYLSDKTSYNEVIYEFPELTEEDIKECLEYSNYVLTNLFEYVRKGNK